MHRQVRVDRCSGFARRDETEDGRSVVVANDDAGRNREVSATEDRSRARAAGSREPGVVARAMENLRETVQSIRLPRPDWRTFAWGLLLLVFIIFIARNWAPLRINFFGWYIDAPRAVVWAIFFALGMVTTWLIEIRHRRAGDDEEQAAEDADDAVDDEAAEAQSTELPAERPEPSPEEFTDETETEAESEVRPEPEDFEADDEDGNSPAFEAEPGEPVVGSDETAGDPLADEYSFATPDDSSDADDYYESDDVTGDDEDWESESEEDEEITGEDDEESSEEGESGKPFWRA